MFNLFYEGGPLFMGTLTIVFFAMLATAVWSIIKIQKGSASGDELRITTGYIKSIGLFAMVIGILGQLIGMFSAFQAIEQMGSVSPAMLAGGLRVSMITTLYGITIYAISLLIWFILDWQLKKQDNFPTQNA